VPTLYISEFATCALDARGQPVAAPEYPLVAPPQIVAITVGSLQSAPFSGHTRFIEFTADAVCHIAIDGDPIATIFHAPVGPGDARFVGVQAGHRLAVLSA